MIKAVIFDIDGVLLDSFETNLKFFQDLMAKAGYPSPTPETFRPIFPLTMRDAIKVLTQSTSEQEIERIWEMGRQRTLTNGAASVPMPEGAEDVIRTLSQTYLLGIVTSRLKEPLYVSPWFAKLEPCFNVVVSYQDTTHHKPHPAPLLLAAQKLGVTPQESVYIGDAASDIAAANAAEMPMILYAKQALAGADACTFSFQELPTLISTLSFRGLSMLHLRGPFYF